MSGKYEIEKFVKENHGKGVYKLYQAIAAKYKNCIYWHPGNTNEEWDNVFVCVHNDTVIGKGQVMLNEKQDESSPSYAEHRIFINIRVLPEFEQDEEVLDLLYNAVCQKANDIKAGLCERKCQLCVGNKEEEEVYNRYFIKKGFLSRGDIYFMTASLGNRTYFQEQYIFEENIAFREFNLNTLEAKIDFLELEGKCFTDDIMSLKHLEEYMDTDFFLMYGVFESGKLIGAVMVTQDDNSLPEIQDVFVLEHYRGRHYARILLEKAMSILNQKGYEKVTLCVQTHNNTALRVYRSLEFVIDGEEKRFLRYI